MKKISLIAILIISSALSLFAQTPYNPFTQNIHFEPEPGLAGFGCNTIQTVVFTQGLTTQADATQFATNPLVVSICITGFTFNGPANTAVSGSYSTFFDWEYDSFAPNCLIGTQNQDLHGTGTDIFNIDPNASGEIRVSLRVPETSPISTVLAVNVNLQVPGYMNQFNSAPDDNESTQTQTFCDLKISGHLFNDTTFNELVDGLLINNASGTGLCATLVGSNGLVIANTPIDASGYYEFLNVAGNTTYNVYLSTVCGTIGSPASIPQLPGSWINVGEDCCDKTGLDGNTNGILVVNVTNSSKVNGDFGIAAITQLPITLKQFTVSEFQCHGVLNWITSSEENTSHVEIFRKDNPQGNFVKIGQVKAAGNSNEDKYYTYLDEKISSQENPYQYYLKFVDIDGQYTKSNISTLKLNCNEDIAIVHVFPNPASDVLNVLFYSEINNVTYEFDIIDVTGRKIMSNSSIVNKGGTQINFDIKQLSSGQYFVRYHNIDDNVTGNIKFIKN